MSKKVLLLSAYDAVSHRVWRERLQSGFSSWNWTQLHLPPRHFAWRIRSNALHWGFSQREILEQDYDLLIASSMVDLASLRGLVPELQHYPALVYFHENQFAYPSGRQRQENLEPLLVPIYSALAAERLVFNSHFNRQSFLDGVQALSKSLPESLPEAALAKLAMAAVIPVPLPDQAPNPDPNKDSDVLNVVWNHRWEYDKGPDLLLELIRMLSTESLRIRLHIVGQQFREQPAQFARMNELLQSHSQHSGISRGEFGFIQDPSRYAALLAACDVVLSTALHDFQGLAIQEACLAGCTPVAPDALAYPEYLPQEFLYQVSTENELSALQISKRLRHLLDRKLKGEGLAKVDLQHLQMANLREEYQRLFSAMGVS